MPIEDVEELRTRTRRVQIPYFGKSAKELTLTEAAMALFWSTPTTQTATVTSLVNPMNQPSTASSADSMTGTCNNDQRRAVTRLREYSSPRRRVSEPKERRSALRGVPLEPA